MGAPEGVGHDGDGKILGCTPCALICGLGSLTPASSGPRPHMRRCAHLWPPSGSGLAAGSGGRCGRTAVVRPLWEVGGGGVGAPSWCALGPLALGATPWTSPSRSRPHNLLSYPWFRQVSRILRVRGASRHLFFGMRDLAHGARGLHHTAGGARGVVDIATNLRSFVHRLARARA